ncbi:ATP-dependent DNA helicase RecG [Lachnospiraceae bacterium KM106-2]|nr:ATP-dependent DNA helicase RecG [Lachnospiraceae bacterium KM106-2]
MRYEESIGAIKGIGQKTEDSYHRLGIETVGDLVEFYPRNYDIYEEIVPIATVEEEEVVTIQGSFHQSVSQKKVRGLTIVSGRLFDYSGSIMVTWFNMPFLGKQLKLGSHYIMRGKVQRKNGMLVIDQPVLMTEQVYTNKLGVLQPIYPLTKGITNNGILKAMTAALKELEFPKDYLPKKVRDQYGLIEQKKAIKTIHFPKNKDDMIEARKRVVFDEFFIFTLAINRLKEAKAVTHNHFVMHPVKEVDEILASLPYRLTNAQLRAFDDIKKDMSGDVMMNRLVQGDVGSGKTIVAALALCMAAKNGYQSTLMVPTEVLAKQHYESLTELYEPFGIKVCLLVGSMTAKEKRVAYEAIKNHEVDVIVGTHALIQDKVEYDKLALVITDEQHRFGVKQRETMANKGESPHVLVMSATPIPRTLAIIVYGDLDLSVIDELPANRLPIKNCVVNTNYRETAYRFIEKEVMAGRQAYVICSMVEESETMEAENVVEYTEKLRQALSPSIQIEYLHGKMKASEKNEIMERFSNGEIQVLVSTTVIEVGVNVPNSTVMMVENAERFGLAQLHQLRGRVGRGKYQSYCIFVSGTKKKDTMQRLEILNKSNDGFYIAEEDLKLRGPGDLFGIRQSGLLEFKMADVFQDAAILGMAAKAAKELTSEETMEVERMEGIMNRIERYVGTILL